MTNNNYKVLEETEHFSVVYLPETDPLSDSTRSSYHVLFKVLDRIEASTPSYPTALFYLVEAEQAYTQALEFVRKFKAGEFAQTPVQETKTLQ